MSRRVGGEGVIKRHERLLRRNGTAGEVSKSVKEILTGGAGVPRKHVNDRRRRVAATDGGAMNSGIGHAPHSMP